MNLKKRWKKSEAELDAEIEKMMEEMDSDVDAVEKEMKEYRSRIRKNDGRF
jgi:polyhydroxyalkanoate synthesis regulator phasin